MKEDNTIIPEGWRQNTGDIGIGEAYLRVFDPVAGCEEVVLSQKEYTIGRGDKATLRVNSKSVSRLHTKVFHSRGCYFVEDCRSLAGTILNGKKIMRSTLKHGDTIQLADIVLQFRTDVNTVEKKQTQIQRKSYDAKKFCYLPSSMSVRFRFVECDAKELFCPGDTLPIGNGGTILPVDVAPPFNACVELELTWPDGKVKSFLTELVNIHDAGDKKLLYLKLHNVPDGKYNIATNTAKISEWHDTEPNVS